MLPIPGPELARRGRSRGGAGKVLGLFALLLSASACAEMHGPEFELDGDPIPETDGGLTGIFGPDGEPVIETDAGLFSIPAPDAAPAPAPKPDAGSVPNAQVDAARGPTDASVPVQTVPDSGAGEPRQDAAAPGDAGSALSDAATAPRDAGSASSCIAARTALDTVVRSCFTLSEGDALCLRLRITDERAQALSLRSRSLTQREAQMGVRCAFQALRTQCLEAEGNALEVCYAER